MKAVLFALLFVLLNACAIGNAPFSERMDSRIGTKALFIDPSRYGNSGDLIRADYLISGKGFTHISKNKDGDILQHWFYSEVLPTHSKKEWVGKCKIIYVVDPITNIIKAWDYDDGANPESCRDWL
jgi:hypothetical protein